MAFNLFKFGPKGTLGVDIGTASVKIVELVKESGRFSLKNYGIISLPEISQYAGQNTMVDAMVAALKELISKSNFSSRDSVASIPSFNTFSTVIELPYLSEKDLARAIPFEAKKYIPLPLQDVVLDWSILNIKETDKLTSKDEYPSVEIFMAAVPKDTVERYRLMFTRAGLRLRALELENTALTRSLIGNDQSPIGVVNIGGRSTSIFIVDKGTVRLSRNYEIGGFEITKMIAQNLGINIPRAESIKQKTGIVGQEGKSILNAVSPMLDKLVLEASRTIQTYEAQKKTKIVKLILTGGLSNMPGLGEYMATLFNWEIGIGSAFGRISTAAALNPIIKEIEPTFAVSIGLAMREI